MSQLRSAVAEASGFDPDELTPSELAAEIAEAWHVRQQLEVAIAAWVENLTGRDGHHELGYSSPTTLLTDIGRMTPGHARQIVSLADTRERAPVAFQAWADGRLSTDQARPLFKAAEALPDVFPEAEERLVDIVEGLDAVDSRKAIGYWRQSVDGPEQDPETQWARRGVSISPTVGGMHRVDGWLTPLAGTALQAALDSLTPPRRHDDIRTPRQRRHDALEDLVRDWLDNGTTPTIGGEKPHINLLSDIDALQGIAGGLHETLDGDIVDIDTLRMIACDCSITRIVIGPDSEIIDIGRKTRVWTTAQRRAIVARDRHCQGPGCRAKPRHCDIHHEDHWADGGETTTDKGKLFCRPCHIQEHLKDRYRRRRRRTEG